MKTMFEADLLYNPDTQAALIFGPFDKVRPSATPQDAVLTSGLPQRESGFLPMSDFRQPYETKGFGRLDRSQACGGGYLVRVVGHAQPQAEPPPRKASAAQKAKHLEHKQYLQRVSTEGSPPLITQATAKKSWDLWLAVRSAVGVSIPVPSAGTGPDGQMFYSWDKGIHHLEAEVFPDRAAEFFYRNRQTGELWGEDYAGGTLPDDLLAKLRLFL
jgi:hypothetical protein